MSTKFYCNSEICSHADKGPFVLELAQESVMDGNNKDSLFFIDLPGEAIMDKNNMATIFCPKCAKEMKPFDQEASTAVNF